MTAYVSDALEPFVARVADEARCGRFHLLGTSGTVTTIAGVHLNLPRYDRRAVDGLWLGKGEVDGAIARLRAMSYAERAANACIGNERADLVLAGCAILEAIRTHFPAERLRIADRGLREGILSQMMRADGVGLHAARANAGDDRRLRPRGRPGAEDPGEDRPASARQPPPAGSSASSTTPMSPRRAEKATGRARLTSSWRSRRSTSCSSRASASSISAPRLGAGARSPRRARARTKAGAG